MKRKLLLSLIASIIVTVIVIAQTRGTPSQLRVKVDALGNLVIAAAMQTNPVTSCQFNNCRLSVDSSGNLSTVITGGSGVGTVTSIATTAPITGGPITTTGTIACSDCGIKTNNITQFAQTTSANFYNYLTTKTGNSSNVVFSDSPTLATPILGTPQSITLTNATGLPVAGLSNLGANIGTWLITPSSANLLSAITDETGSGVAVFGTSPTFTTDITAPLVIGGTGASSTLTFKSTSGVGTTDAIIFQTGNNGATEAARFTTGGNFGLNTSTILGGIVAKLHTVVTATSGTIQISDAVKANSNSPLYVFRSARGTPASPTKTLSGDGIGAIVGRGYQETTGAFTTANNASIAFNATEDYTSTAQGTQIIFQVTPAGGSVTPATQMVINPASFTLGSMVAPAATGVRYLCISTAGVVTSQAAACVGT